MDSVRFPVLVLLTDQSGTKRDCRQWNSSIGFPTIMNSRIDRVICHEITQDFTTVLHLM